MNGNGVLQETSPQGQVGRLTRTATERAPILTLVQREYLKSTANLPRAVWEPMSYLYSEADQSMARVRAMEVPPTLEWAREAAITKWHQAVAWLDELLVTSQSVDALRSWQLMSGLQSNNGRQDRASAAVMPDFPQPQPPGVEPAPRRKPRGLRLP